MQHLQLIQPLLEVEAVAHRDEIDPLHPLLLAENGEVADLEQGGIRVGLQPGGDLALDRLFTWT
ncbi:hypothetical protein D3C76_1542890 [compost metagenome]